jgi:hypothetical protein
MKKFCSLECLENYRDIHNRVIKKCKNCNNDFKCSKIKDRNKNCCSEECNIKYRADKIEKRECLLCKKEFESPKWEYKVFCSKECREESLNLNNRIIKKCVICGEEFKCAKARNELKNYCSKECKNKDNKEMKVKVEEGKEIKCVFCNEIINSINKKFCLDECKNKYLNINNTVIKQCKICNKDFKCTKSKGKSQNYCSKECRNKRYEKDRHIQKCKECEKDFSVSNYLLNRKKFCSKKCKEKYLDKNNRIIKKCVICGEEFKCSKSESEWKETCSKECAKINVEQIKINGHEIRKCIQCEKEFECFKSSQQICCSKECREKYINRTIKIKEECTICHSIKYVVPSRHRTEMPICNKPKCKSALMSMQKMGENNPNYIGRVRNTNCIVCKKEYKDYMGNSIFCSLECRGKWQEENLCGENNPFYGHHHTEEVKRVISEKNRKGWNENINRAIRGFNRYKVWRKSVYVRDDWTCQVCGIRGGSLHAHHIKELYKLIEEYPDIEAKYIEDPFGLMDDDYFWDIENGQTCHVECHYETYHTKKL